MNTKYMTAQHLDGLEDRLSSRDRRIVETVERLGLLSGAQLRRLHFEDERQGRSDAQICRRALLRLTRLDVLARLDRRVGGVKSGSDGFCYRTAPAGQQLTKRWFEQPDGRGRRRPEPGERFVAHRLAVSEIYVKLVEACRRGKAPDCDLLEFQTEPECWRPYVGAHGNRQLLKPDGFARIGVGDQELWWFLEADLGSVSQRTRSDQAEAYRTFWRSGAAASVMPRVLWCCHSEAVAAKARQALRLDRQPADLFEVTTLEQAITAAMRAEI